MKDLCVLTLGYHWRKIENSVRSNLAISISEGEIEGVCFELRLGKVVKREDVVFGGRKKVCSRQERAASPLKNSAADCCSWKF